MIEYNFRDICGHLLTLSLPSDAAVSQACELISQKLEIPETQIFLVSPNEEQNFYQDHEVLSDLSKENPEYFIFTKCFHNNSNFKQSNPNLIPFKKMNNKLPFKFFINLNYMKRKLHDQIYEKYSKSVNEIPEDLQQKIDEIAVLGFELEDIKEALRNSEYNVLFAINSLVYRNSNEKNQEENNHISIDNHRNGNLRLFSFVNRNDNLINKSQHETIFVRKQFNFNLNNKSDKENSDNASNKSIYSNKPLFKSRFYGLTNSNSESKPDFIRKQTKKTENDLSSKIPEKESNNDINLNTTKTENDFTDKDKKTKIFTYNKTQFAFDFSNKNTSNNSSVKKSSDNNISGFNLSGKKFCNWNSNGKKVAWGKNDDAKWNH